MIYKVMRYGVVALRQTLTPRLVPPPWRLKLKWSLRLVLRQRLLLFREALICLSYSGGEVRLPYFGRPAR